MYKKICQNCYREYTGDVCPNCGYYPEPQSSVSDALQNGYLLGGRYSIVQLLDCNAVCFTYFALDTKMNTNVSVKEFFPEGVVKREADGSVSVVSRAYYDSFLAGKNDTLNEARNINHYVNNRNVALITDYFEFNNTAYVVSEYVEGMTLADYIYGKGGRITMDKARAIFIPIMDAAAEFHSSGIVHLNISPDSIIISNTGVVKLIDFSHSMISYACNTRSQNAVLKHGYAPCEMYSQNGRIGPYSDVYSLAAVLYSAVTGGVLPDATDRFEGEYIVYPSELGVDITPGEENALKTALNIDPSRRFGNMGFFKDEFMNTNARGNAFDNMNTPPANVPDKSVYEETPDTKSKKSFPKWIIPAAAGFAVLVVAGIIGVIMLTAANPAKDFKYSVNSDGVTIVKYIGTDDNVKVPSEIEGKPVDVIGKSSFTSSAVTDVELPDSVKKIGKSAFAGSSLKNIVLPDSLNEVGELAFDGSSIENITVPGSVKKIKFTAFKNCRELKSVTINSGVKEIGNEAFYDCDKLKDLKLPDSLECIGESAFSGCNEMTEVTIPNNVSTIKKYAFTSCEKLKVVKASGSRKSSKKGKVYISAFSSCKKLKKITLPKGIKEIAKGFIWFDKNIEVVKLPDGLTKIGASAFNSCKNLKQAKIPSSVKYIGKSAFSGCKKLQSINIPRKLKVIKGFAFSGCKSLKSIYIPSTVKKLERQAFYECSSVKKIHIASGKTIIKKFVFSGCKKVKSLVVPGKTKVIGRDAFFGLDGLKHVVIPKSVKSIKHGAFLSSKKLKRVLVSRKCKINKYAFAYDTKVRKIK